MKLFSVILTVHDAASYLPLCLRHLEKQSLGFEEYVDVVAVGYGASPPDSGMELARNWAEKFSENVRVLPRMYASLAEARNAGLRQVRGEWCTFLHAKDFLREDYFSVVHDFITANTTFNGAYISCKSIQFNEVSNVFLDNSPFRRAYDERQTIVDCTQHPEYIQTDVVGCLFRTTEIQKASLFFDPRVCPSFGEGHFIYRFMLQSGLSQAAFLRNAVYIHRLRKSPGALIDLDWSAREKYQNQLLFGYMDLVKRAVKTHGSVPEYIQYVLVFETHAYLDRMLENQIPREFAEQEAKAFFDLLRLVFVHVDATVILFAKLPMVGWRHRVAMLRALKDLSPQGLPFFVHEVANNKKSMLLVRYTGEEETCSARTAQGGAVRALWEKRVVREFAGQRLCVEHYLWFPLEPELSLSFWADGQESTLLCGKDSFNAANGTRILAAWFLPESALPERVKTIREAADDPAVRKKFAHCWLLMDRANRADDNAEHFYRWLMNNTEMTRPIFYVLEKKSPDWDRLRQEGFALLAHNSKEHLMACFHAEWVLTSHLHYPLFDPLGTKAAFGLPDYQVAFLQHGIIKDDMSRWILPMPIDLFVTSTREEYESIAFGKYKCTERDVVLSGLPRHDSLFSLKKRAHKSKLVLVCPTWRDNLCNPHTQLPPGPAEATMFTQSDYYNAWNTLTKSEEVRTLAEQYGYRFIFFPHPYISRNVDLFNFSKRFRAKKYSEQFSAQDLLANCVLLITDYSSMAMEVSLLGTPVIYYQFAEDPPFFSGHTYTKGYFDYERDGFGPIAYDFAALLRHIETMFASGCIRGQAYTQRAESFFTVRDGKSCERVYAALLERS